MDISIVVPTHDRAALLRKTLRSLTRQSISSRRFEVIVVDHGSTESIRDICAEFGSSIDIVYQRLERQARNVNEPRNAGIRTARGKYIALLDCSMVVPNSYLQSHLERLNVLWVMHLVGFVKTKTGLQVVA